MKRYLPILLLLAACGGSEDTTTKDLVDITKESDSLEVLVPTVDSVEYKPEVNEHLKALLDNPIDLQAFKKEWGPANGGPRVKDETLHYPEEEGTPYEFMLFNKLRQGLPSHPDEGTLFSQFKITVYRFGDEIGDFYDTNEELIMIKCGIDNIELGELNWYGKTKIGIMDTYGPPQYEQDDCLIFTYDQKTITAHLNNGQVDWYKYVKLNNSIDLSEAIPGILLDF